MPDGSNWPKISIVTPSYNQGQFIEETIRSVLLQGYPNIEYIIIDGGSKDSTVEVIKKYEPFITYWVSEKDNGQANALNKGFARATGEIFYWINSDDYPEKDVFKEAIRQFKANEQLDVIYGNCWYIDANGQNKTRLNTFEFSFESLIENNFIAQPTVFFTARLWQEFGKTRETLKCAMDYELWLRWTLKGFEFKFCPEIVAYYRLHENSKTISLVKTSQNETLKLLLEAQDTNRDNKQLKQSVAKAIYRLCVYNYWDLNLPQFWYFLFQYVKYTKKFPGFSLLRKAFLALLGTKVNKFAFKVFKLARR
jgi:glycosyltransferase involved in cell wall biosynthesis